MSHMIAAFNAVAQYKNLDARLTLMLEEIVMLIESGLSNGLQAKAQAAIPVWVDWQEWNRVHRNGGKLLSNLRVAETDLVLHAAAAGCEPCEILRQVIQLRDDVQREISASVLEHFNDFAEFKVMETEMWLRIEEICIAIDSDQGEGLDDKCADAIPLWQTWIEWNRTHNREFKAEEPKQLQITLLLQVGVLGLIRRRSGAACSNHETRTAGPIPAHSRPRMRGRRTKQLTSGGTETVRRF